MANKTNSKNKSNNPVSNKKESKNSISNIEASELKSNIDINKDIDNLISLNEDIESPNLKSSDQTTTCEDVHKDIKVNIGDTKIIESNKKNNHKWIKIIGAIIICVALLVFIGFKLVYNSSKYEDKFDDINELRKTYSNTGCEFGTKGCNDDKILQSNAISALFDNMVVNNDGTASINVPKSLIYAYISLDTLNDFDFIKDNDIKIKQFGYDLDIDNDNKYINIYSDITYKNIKATLTATLSFEFDNDNLIIRFKDAKIGDLPKFIYSFKLPKEDTIIYQKDISYSVSLADNVSIKIFSPSEIKDISYDEKTGIISIDFNYKDALSNIGDELFNTDNGSSKLSDIINYYLTTDIDVDGIIEKGKDYLEDTFGVDIDNLLDFLK